MKPRVIFTISLLLIVILVQFMPASAAPHGDVEVPDEWEEVATSVDYQIFHLHSPPNNVHVTRMDRSNLNVSIESGIGQGRLIGGRQTVRGMAESLDQAINYWGRSWGKRNNVIAAINGYFFDYSSGIPWRGQVHSGWYAKRFDNHENGSGFAWQLDREAFIGGCVYHIPSKQFVTYINSGDTQKFHGINIERDDDELIMYTPQYASNTHTDNSGVEILVEMTKPTSILPDHAPARGVIREIRDRQGSTPIPFDHIVLSATGVVRTTMLSKINIGDEIGIVQEIKHYESNCNTTSSYDWTNTYASIGGSFHFLKEGQIQSFTDPGANVRNPRTAIAYNNDFIYFIVVDGRDPGVSEGMNMTELGHFAKNYLNATEGINQDGGSSSTMVVDGQVVNNTTCNIFNCSKRVEEVEGNIPIDDLNNPPDSSSIENYVFVDDDKPEYLVANSMMIVVVEPLQKSTTFNPGEWAIPIESTNVRLGPGSNYASIGTISAHTPGVFQAHSNQLNGVLAKGSNWWKVAFGNIIGWVKEETLYEGHTPGEFKLYLPSVNR